MWNNLSNKVSLDEIIKAVNNARRILRDYKKILEEEEIEQTMK